MKQPCSEWEIKSSLNEEGVAHSSVIIRLHRFIHHHLSNIGLCVYVLQVFQEEMGMVKSYNLKPGGDKIPVTKQNRKGESRQERE